MCCSIGYNLYNLNFVNIHHLSLLVNYYYNLPNLSLYSLRHRYAKVSILGLLEPQYQSEYSDIQLLHRLIQLLHRLIPNGLHVIVGRKGCVPSCNTILNWVKMSCLSPLSMHYGA